MPTWEYKVIPLGSAWDSQDKLEELGEEGWELVAVINTLMGREGPEGLIGYFKKAKA